MATPLPELYRRYSDIRYDSVGRPVQIPSYSDYAPQREASAQAFDSYRKAAFEAASKPPGSMQTLPNPAPRPALQFADPPKPLKLGLDLPLAPAPAPAPAPATSAAPAPAPTAAPRANFTPTVAAAAASAAVSVALGADVRTAAASAAGTVGGSWAGGALGAAVGGPLGAAIGSAVGGAIGGLAGNALGNWATGGFSPPQQAGTWDAGTGRTWVASDFPAGGRYEIGFAAPGAAGGVFALQIPADAGFSTSYYTRSDGVSYWTLAVPSMNIAAGVIGITSPNPVRVTPLDGQPQPKPPDPEPLPTIPGLRPLLAPANFSPTSAAPAVAPAAAPSPSTNPLPGGLPVGIPGFSPNSGVAATPSGAPAPTPGGKPLPSPAPFPQPAVGGATSPNTNTANAQSTSLLDGPRNTTSSTSPYPKIDTTPSPAPEPAPLPANKFDPCQPNSCGAANKGAADDIKADLEKIKRVLAVDDFPATLPLIAGEGSHTIANIPEMLIWIVRNTDAVAGLWPAKVKIVRADGTSQEIQLESIGHAIEELFAALLIVAEDADAAVNIGARLAVESIQTKISTKQSGEMLEGIIKFLGFSGKPTARKIKIGFTPAAAGADNKLQNDEMAAFLEPSEQNYVGYENPDKDELLPILKRILQDAEIARAALFHPLKKGPKGESSLTGEYLKSEKKKKNPVAEAELKKLLDTLKKAGFKTDVDKKPPK